MGNYLSYFQYEEHLNEIIKEKVKKYVVKELKELKESETNKESEKNKENIEEWKSKYLSLLSDYEILKMENKQREINTSNNTNTNTNTNINSISITALKDYIENEILSTEANSKYIPDAIERRAYLTIYKTVLETFLQLSNNTNLTLLNHKIGIHLEPL